jgi:hypothetical protein
MIKVRYRPLFALSVIATTTLVAPLADAATGAAIAGLAPYQRPDGAPQITAAPANDSPGSRFLHGVTQPVPASLKFLSDQGNWYSPFSQPGMPGPYDIRGWYTNPPAARKQ